MTTRLVQWGLSLAFDLLEEYGNMAPDIAYRKDGRFTKTILQEFLVIFFIANLQKGSS